MTKVDVLIIGAGTAGEYAASYAMGNGRSVAMIERGEIGGSCIFNACIPTKALVHVSTTFTRMRGADLFGLPRLREDADYRRVKAFKDGVVAGIAAGRSDRWRSRGVQLFSGVARFRSPHEVQVGDDIIDAGKIIICTGSSAVAPPIPGLTEVGYITNREALQLEVVPPRLAIIGGGAVGVEFAQIFSVFGAQVHIIEAMDRILAAEDPDVSAAIEDSMRLRKVAVLTSVKVTVVEKAPSAKIVQVQQRERRHAGY